MLEQTSLLSGWAANILGLAGKHQSIKRCKSHTLLVPVAALTSPVQQSQPSTLQQSTLA